MAEHRDTRRRFEQWARNPDCLANTISAVHGVAMAEVAKSEGIEPSMGQSPFAIARGQGFERTLFENDAARLRKALVVKELLEAGQEGFLDFRLRLHGGSCPNLDSARSRTTNLLTAVAGARPSKRAALPSIVAGATIRIPGGVMLPEAILVIDVLLIRWVGDRPELMVGEIKTYPDRGGYTDGAELATARAQAGVYVHGLEAVLTEELLAKATSVARSGFLVLSRPGFNLPSVRAGEDLRYQVERARRGFARLREVAETISIENEDERISAVRDADCAYSEGCISFCDRAPLCYGRALKSANPIVLGEEVARFLGSVSLDRACGALLAGAEPGNYAEEDIARRIRDVEALRQVA